MPIDIDRFEETDDLSPPPTSERILRLLVANADQAYTRQEIADAIDASPETVGTNLTRLKDSGLVRHREPYWALTTDREHAITTLRTRYNYHSTADEWMDHAATSDSHNQARDSQSAETTGENETHAGISSSAKPTSRPHREATTAFFEHVRNHLAASIDTLTLFGSVARQTATADSDVDVLAVVCDDADYLAVDDQLLDIAYDVQLQYGVRVEVHSLSTSEFAARKKRDDPFIRTVVEEGTANV